MSCPPPPPDPITLPLQGGVVAADAHPQIRYSTCKVRDWRVHWSPGLKSLFEPCSTHAPKAVCVTGQSSLQEAGHVPQVQTLHLAQGFPGRSVESPEPHKFKEGPIQGFLGSFLLKIQPPQETASLGNKRIGSRGVLRGSLFQGPATAGFTVKFRHLE